MKFIPKFLKGLSFYTIFDTVTPPKISSNLSQQTSSSKSSTEDDGKLTEKDLFTMLKDIDGLPNERKALYDLLSNIFGPNKIVNKNTKDIASIYLKSLFYIKTAIDNKKEYDEALKTAVTNGAMNEPAISPNGKLIIQKNDGSLDTISLQEYSENPEEYNIVTVSNIAHLRKYDPEFVNKNEVFNIITNSMGFESFLKLIDLAKINLSSTTYTRNGQFTAEGKASKGLELLEKLKDDPRLSLIIGSITLEGLYEYKLIDEDNLKLIKALVNYLVATLPDKAKTWAAFKIGNPDKNKATLDLVFQYLLGSAKLSQTVDINYKGSIAHAMGKSSSGSGGKEEDPKAGYWRLVLAGQGGENASFNIMLNNGIMSVDGKYYGAVPGVELNCSLGDFLAKSGANYLLKDSKKITFGNVKLITDSFDDVMINTRSGLFVVTLPSKNGLVDFDVLDKYVEVMNELDRLKKDGLKENTPEYVKKYKDLMEEAQLSHLLNTNGLPRTDRFGNFLVLEGLTSDRARLIDPLTNKTVNVGDVKSNYILNAGDDPELYRILQDGLSSKERGDYKLDKNEWYDVPSYWGSYDKLYKGNIYIPITNNPINGMNADKNDMKESSAYEYEEATLMWNKINNLGSTNSEQIDQ